MVAGAELHYRRILRTGIWYYLNLKLGILCFGIQLFFDLSFEKTLKLKEQEVDGLHQKKETLFDKNFSEP